MMLLSVSPPMVADSFGGLDMIVAAYSIGIRAFKS